MGRNESPAPLTLASDVLTFSRSHLEVSGRYKSVLVATDLLPTSLPALRAGLRLAQEQGSKVGVLYVVEVWMVERQWFTSITEEDIAYHRAFLKREEDAALHAK